MKRLSFFTMLFIFYHNVSRFNRPMPADNEVHFNIGGIARPGDVVYA